MRSLLFYGIISLICFYKVKGMNVNFEFLDRDTIENVITCMNYKFDKVVFFGEFDIINEQKSQTKYFLNKYCNVDSVEFHTLSSHNIDSVLEKMDEIITNEFDNNIFFDITGGEGVIPVAFGMLAQKYNLPVHIYDIEKNKLYEQDNMPNSLSSSVASQNITLGIKEYIEMYGGIVNFNFRKSYKNIEGSGIEEYIDDIWKISKKHYDLWNPFSSFARKVFNPDSNSQVNLNASSVINALNQSNNALHTPRDLNAIIDDLEAVGAVKDVVHSNGRYAFKYTNESIKDCLFDGGSILEFKTYIEEKKSSFDCMVGVHIDWDGVIHDKASDVVDVLNEIDVLSIDKNTPTFISCKSGKMTSGEAMQAMYELDTVAKRFGGNFSKKVLALSQALRPSDVARAEEMNIEIRYYD